ncbi:dopamine beta-hydroxylase-like [Lingula anatina]|uniref:Dopamine beta-hydroxylase n=1 Tax=Lingula anatina TaxID=7574 RepID=A0A1S3KCD6_LINAN|nr:dopamine beta-hydroxylase-like [Lingula anatina]|eukprot:XP_013420099.1 dopamine beta-hydroxylase-like [Lingula anatina]
MPVASNSAIQIYFLLTLAILLTLPQPRGMVSGASVKSIIKTLARAKERLDVITEGPNYQSTYTDDLMDKKEEFPFMVNLDAESVLKWGINSHEKTIRFQVTVPKLVSGIGVGFSDYGETSNTDWALLWSDLKGKSHFQDYWSDNKSILHRDKGQDYRLIGLTKEEKQTQLTFERAYDTCDRHDYVIDNGTTHILFYTADNNIASPDGVNVSSAAPILQRVQLLKPGVELPSLPDDAHTFEILAPNVTVPAEETTYWCYVATMPRLTAKHHIVQFEAVIKPGNEHLVHHMEVFHCEVPPNKIVPSYNALCHAETKPEQLKSCTRVIGAWAKGAQPFVYPLEAGYSVGGPSYSNFVLLEVHYNNPDRLKGKVDSSGIRFHYTPKLRSYDAGVMELGLIYSNAMAVPPGREIFKLSGHCVSHCTEKGLPKPGIKIFASQLHTHLTGRRVYTKHVREGTELPELNRDNHYSPHFQEIRLLPEPRLVYPGDGLITICEDNTMKRENVTMSGFSIADEMCVNYVHYYPKVDLEVCKSSIDPGVLSRYFTYMKKFFQADTSPQKSLRENYSSIPWTNETSTQLQSLYDNFPLEVECRRSSGELFPGTWTEVSQDRITKPFHADDDPCSEVSLMQDAVMTIEKSELDERTIS